MPYSGNLMVQPTEVVNQVKKILRTKLNRGTRWSVFPVLKELVAQAVTRIRSGVVELGVVIQTV